MSSSISMPFRQLPANFGPLKGAQCTARILGPCGDTMQFWLRVEQERVAQASFTTDGCGASIVSGATAASLITGKTLEEALALTPSQVESAVGGLPEDHQHCPVLAVNTLRAAIQEYCKTTGRSIAACPEPAPTASSGQDTSSGPAAPQNQELPDEAALKRAVSRIGFKLLVLSGKGGVGKSTVAVNLATALATAGYKVGLLDIDIHGPSIPKLLGLEGAEPKGKTGAIQPIPAGPNLSVMSMGFLLPSPRDAVIWRGLLKAGLIRQFLSGITWGDLDVLVVDSPPGTGDEPLSVAQMLGPGTAAVLVTTPQAVAVADVRRSVTFCQKLQLEVLGIIENMSGLDCPHCGKTTNLFGAGGGEALAREMGVPFLGPLPLDPEVVLSGDTGKPFVQRFSQGRSAHAMQRIIEPILTQIKTNGQSKAATIPTDTHKTRIPAKSKQ